MKLAGRTALAARAAWARAVARLRRRVATPFFQENGPGLLAALAVFALHANIFATQGGFHGVDMPDRADGHYIYMYARSIVYDHDVDFRNDYALCGDPFGIGIDRGTGHLDDPFYVGPSVFWVPVLAVTRLFVASDAPEAVRFGCMGAHVGFTMFVGVVCAAATVFLSYRIATRLAAPWVAAFAAALFGVSSSFTQYSAVEPSYSHIYSAFAVALLVWASIRAVETGRLRDMFVVAAALTLCTLQRITDLGFVVIPLGLIATTAGLSVRAKLLRAGIVSAGGALGLAIIARLFTYLYGSPWVVPQGRHYVHLAHAHPWLVLFGAHGGLFFSTPVAYLSFFGWMMTLRVGRHRTLAITSGLAFVMCLWVSASPLDWHAGGTVGARRLVTVTALFVCFAAVLLDRVVPWVRRHATRIVAVGALAASAFFTVGFAFGTRRGTLSWEAGSQAEYYGGAARDAFALIDRRVGDVAILPAEVVYALRYSLPLNTFRDATADRYYKRSYHDLKWLAKTLDLHDPQLQKTMRGFTPVAEGARVDAEGHVVFAASWPFATRLSAVVVAPRTTELRFGIRTWTGTHWLGSQTAKGGAAETLSVAVPPGLFDSGIVEIVVEDLGRAGTEMRRIEIDDEAEYPPAY